MRSSLLIIAAFTLTTVICAPQVSSQIDDTSFDTEDLLEIIRERRGSRNLSRQQEVVESTETRKPDLGDTSDGRTSHKTAAPSRKPGQRWSRRGTTTARPSPLEPLSSEEHQSQNSTSQEQRSRPDRGRRKYSNFTPQNSSEVGNESSRLVRTERAETATVKPNLTTAERRVSKNSKRIEEQDISEDDNYPEAFKQQIRRKKPVATSTVAPRSRTSKNVTTESSEETSTQRTSTSPESSRGGSRRSTTSTTSTPETTSIKASVLNSRNAILRQSNRGRNNPNSAEAVTEVTQVTSITAGGTSRVRYSAKHRRLHVPPEQRDSSEAIGNRQRFSAKFSNDVTRDTSVESTAAYVVTEPSIKDVTRRPRDRFSSPSPQAQATRSQPVPHVPSTRNVTNKAVPILESTTISTQKSPISTTPSSKIEYNETSLNTKDKTIPLLYIAPPNRAKTTSSNTSLPLKTFTHNTSQNKTSYDSRNQVDEIALNVNTILSDNKQNDDQVTNISSVFETKQKWDTTSVNRARKNSSNGDYSESSTKQVEVLNKELQVQFEKSATQKTTVKPNPTIVETIRVNNKQRSNSIKNDSDANRGALLINEIFQVPTEISTKNSVPKPITTAAELRQNSKSNETENSLAKSVNSISNEILPNSDQLLAASLKSIPSTLHESTTSRTTTVIYTGSYSKYTTNNSSPKPVTSAVQQSRTTTNSATISTFDASTQNQVTLSLETTAVPDTTTHKCLDGTMSRTLCLVNSTHLKVLKVPHITTDNQVSSTTKNAVHVTKLGTTTNNTPIEEPLIVTPVPLALTANEKPLTSQLELFNLLQNSVETRSVRSDATITVTPTSLLNTPNLLNFEDFAILDDKKESDAISTTTSRSTYIYRVPPSTKSQSSRGRNRARGVKNNSVTTETSTTSTTTLKPTTESTTWRSISTTPAGALSSAAELAAQFAASQRQRHAKPEHKNVRNPSHRNNAETTTTTTTQKSTIVLPDALPSPANVHIDIPSTNLEGLTAQDLLILELLSKRRPETPPASELTSATTEDGGLLLSSLLAETQRVKNFNRAVTTDAPRITTEAYVIVSHPPEQSSGSNLFGLLRQISGGSSGFQQPAVRPTKNEEIYLEPATTAPTIQPHRPSKRQRNNLRGRITTSTVPPPTDVFIIDEQETDNSQSNLVSTAINVTKSVAGFMGRFLQGAARTVTAVVSTSGRALADYLQTWQNPPTAAQQK